MGALLAPGKRTVSSCLRMTGRAEAANFASYHQILNRACWSPRAVARRLLGLVVEQLVPDGKRPPQAFFSTDITLEPADIIALFVRRWQIEVTFAETRAHLGVETQRQWSDKAIARTTPALLGLYSLVSLWACDLLSSTTTPYAAAWYRKTSLTFTDAIGAVRLKIWIGDINQHSPPNRERQNIPLERILRMAQALCFAT